MCPVECYRLVFIFCLQVSVLLLLLLLPLLLPGAFVPSGWMCAPHTKCSFFPFLSFFIEWTHYVLRSRDKDVLRFVCTLFIWTRIECIFDTKLWQKVCVCVNVLFSCLPPIRHSFVFRQLIWYNMPMPMNMSIPAHENGKFECTRDVIAYCRFSVTISIQSICSNIIIIWLNLFKRYISSIIFLRVDKNSPLRTTAMWNVSI